ncbi:MAG: hypothetical protein ACRDRK_21905 [Pseudonocardia sp.]
MYHVLEDELRSAVPEEVWEEQVGLMVDVLEVAFTSPCVPQFSWSNSQYLWMKIF